LYGAKTVHIIEPIRGVKVADVVWNELYQEMMDSLSQTDRHSVQSFNPHLEAGRPQDTRSLRSLNLVGEGGVEEAARSDTLSLPSPFKRIVVQLNDSIY
ncbi:hypothetical protein ANCDUO_16512, partial [Ancylostoma duodenale]